MRHLKFLLLFSLFLMYTSQALATHNRAGEITYTQSGELTIIATVTTYTKSTSTQADKDSILVDWGDGTTSFVLRTNGQGSGVDLGNNVKFNTYVKSHTYPGRATYTICMVDPNRVAEIENLNYPNSENIRFSIQTTFTFTNKQFDGDNSSVRLLQPPIDIACINQTFIHKPNAYDEDGDSLAFELTTPFKECGISVDDYKFPNEIIPTDNNFFFDKTDGTIIWDSPKKPGEYNVAFFVYEYRNGELLNTVLRDMQIFVRDCENKPPEIIAPDEICVIAGDTVEFEVTVTDPDIGQRAIIEATGSPFLITPNTATFDALPVYTDVPFTVKFQWITRCEDISDNPYQVVFRAVDNFFTIGDLVTGLADLHDTKIYVTGPPPENLAAESDKSVIELNWDLLYACEDTEDMYFQGFSIWRSESSINLTRDTCNPGIENMGYIEIGPPQINIVDGRYYFEDFDVEKGKTYCYRVVAEFAQLSIFGYPFNFVQSLFSDEVCIQLARDIPLLTKASVIVTDPSDGQIEVEWIKPDPVQLDTIEYPGPYRYQLQRATDINGTNFIDIPPASFTTALFSDPVSLFFLDTKLNTTDNAYNYRVAFFADGVENFYDFSPTSSSVYLNINSTDQTNKLQWDYNTSWVNEQFFIYRFNNTNATFEIIDSTINDFYDDIDLTNGIEYCYIVESEGSYETDQLPDFLYNFSNETCGIPLDTIPPCTPMLAVSNACDIADETTPEEDFENTLTWERIDLICPFSDDLAAYRIYFKTSIMSDFTLLDEITDIQVTSYNHKPQTGLTACYAISSVDSLGNESASSPFICIEDCPSYILPNAFTPNGDNDNDLFIPILNRFVSSIRFEVRNEWGQKVFETADANINWDGTNLRGLKLNDGVYYYTCEVFQNSTDEGEVSYDFLKGFIQILKSE